MTTSSTSNPSENDIQVLQNLHGAYRKGCICLINSEIKEIIQRVEIILRNDIPFLHEKFNHLDVSYPPHDQMLQRKLFECILMELGLDRDAKLVSYFSFPDYKNTSPIPYELITVKLQRVLDTSTKWITDSKEMLYNKRKISNEQIVLLNTHYGRLLALCNFGIHLTKTGETYAKWTFKLDENGFVV